MSSTSRRPASLDDTPAPVVVTPGPVTQMSDGLRDLDESLRRRRTIRRPSTVEPDVWEVVEEMLTNGGLFDLTVEIARLESLHKRLDTISKMDGEMLPIEHVKMLMKLAKEIAAMKSRAAEITMKTKQIITIDAFRVILEGIKLTLQRHISDPHLLQKISDDLGATLRAALTQVRSS